jgi:DNA-directed RNA polymerase specialized sigma24 family protein
VAADDEGDTWTNMRAQLPLLIEGLHFYDKYLIQKHYMEQMTIGELSKLTRITPQRLSQDIKEALIELKEQLTKKNIK